MKNLKDVVGKNVILPKISFPTFKRLLEEYYPKTKLARTVSACCSKCLRLDAEIKELRSDINTIKKMDYIDDIVKASLSSKKTKLKNVVNDQNNHRQLTKKEREFYSRRVRWLKEMNVNNNKIVLSELNRVKRENVLHLSIDAMQNKKYPTFTRHKEPSIYYFIKKITLHILGVIDEGSNKGRVYLYDERLGATHSNHVISALLDMMNQLLGRRRILWINMDNCAVNKNRFVRINLHLLKSFSHSLI